MTGESVTLVGGWVEWGREGGREKSYSLYEQALEIILFGLTASK